MITMIGRLMRGRGLPVLASTVGVVAVALLALVTAGLSQARLVTAAPIPRLFVLQDLDPRIDRDQDGLTDRFERRRSRTDPDRRDTDGDGLGDGYEVLVSRTSPRRPERLGIAAAVAVGTSSSPASEPAAPAYAAGNPPGNERPQATGPPRPPETDLPPEPPPPDPPVADGEVADAAALLAVARSDSSAGKTYLLRGGGYGDVDLRDVRQASLLTFRAYPGEVPSFGKLTFARSQRLRFDGVRASTVDIQAGSAALPNVELQFAACTLGGTQAQRINPLAVFGLGGHSRDVLIDRCGIGWTEMNGREDHGNGVRAVNGDLGLIERLTIRRSRLHHLSCDAIQVAGALDFTLDRTEISYVAPEPGYGCHADSLQNLGFEGDGARITNNYIHHIGYYDELDSPSAGSPAGQLIYHNDSDGGGALIENNLFVDSRNYALNLGSGCGGCPPRLSNVVLRRNTIVRSGTAFGGESAPDLRWAPTEGSGNRFERNVIGSIAADGSLEAGVVVFSDNVFTHRPPIGPGDVGPVGLSFDADMNCISVACSNAGYRKPEGVGW